MKKLLIAAGMSLLVVVGNLAAETEKRFHLGLDIGGSTIVEDVNGYRVGGELGVRFSRRVGFVVDFGYVYAAYSSEYKDYLSKSLTYSSFPASGSLVLITPVTEDFSVHIGLGLGYYSTKIREQRIYHNEPAFDPSCILCPTDSVSRVKNLAPHVFLGIEAKTAERIAMSAGIKHIIGKAEWDIEGPVEDVYFGGPELRIGVRFYF